MKDYQKVYIKGNPSRGTEVIKALTDLGAINLNNLDGKRENAYYYISPLGIIIVVASYEKNMISILKEFYTEISLERWKPEYEGQYYYFIDIKGGILQKMWFDTLVDNQCYKFGNCFRTKEEAEAARDEFKEILNK